MRAKFTALFKRLSKRIIKGLSSEAVGRNSKGQITKFFDVYSEDIIISFLRKNLTFPAVVISEEKARPIIIGNGVRPYTVIIDPVDGSDNYRNRVPFVCMGIAIFDPDGEPFMSFAGNFYSGDHFYADQKIFYASYTENKKPENSILFTFSKISSVNELKIKRIIKQYGTVRSFGATIGELILVMKGAYAAFADVRGKLTLENFAPFFLAQKHGRIILTDPLGEKFKLKGYSLSAGYELIATAGTKEHLKLRGIL